ncbi:hypothetical protein PR048_032737 [Dryococelus australis]|uniref:DUF4371 domain-containing protein n=1 Tax=Dryococelus australis TaxID=614101 RepID=A0ABQ9G315_9NEOP|nr:hypothetical protein PR048_032737 [Dryococelus australis]
MCHGVLNQHREEELLGNITNLSVNYSDPATWEQCDNRLCKILVEHGPEQVKEFKFPLDDKRRKFSVVHYKMRLINGEYLLRPWLQYLPSKDAVFCFCCMLFLKTGRLALCSSLSDWKNVSAILASYEKANDHTANFQERKELETRLKRKKTFDEEHLCMLTQEEKFWHQILERLIALVLGSQNLAFRGTQEKWISYGNGNYLKFVEYLSLFNPIMHEHLRKLGKAIQNEFIQVLSNAIQEEILSAVHGAKYFSIVLDCTPDVSHIEQMTIIVRFVTITDAKGSEIKEHFLGLVPISDTTSSGLTTTILEKFADMTLPIENLHGQGYDNGSNVKGKNININVRAFFCTLQHSISKSRD